MMICAVLFSTGASSISWLTIRNDVLTGVTDVADAGRSSS
jgi:hypothetical protein